MRLEIDSTATPRELRAAAVFLLALSNDLPIDEILGSAQPKPAPSAPPAPEAPTPPEAPSMEPYPPPLPNPPPFANPPLSNVLPFPVPAAPSAAVKDISPANAATSTQSASTATIP